MEQVILQGHKGGDKKAHTPVEEKNTLLSKSYAKLLLAIGEGEFAGTPTAENIFLDGTPLKSAGGLDNFGGVKWDYRSGRTDQTYIAGLPDISNEFAINLALTNTTPWTRLITTQQLDAVRITLAWAAVFEQKDNGDVVGYNIEYAIDVSTNGGAYVEQGKWSTNNQKTTVEYNRTHRITLPKPGTSWTVRVRRITPNKNNGKFGDIMSVKSIAEVIDAKLRYPNTALLYLEFDAEAFGGSSIPKVSIKTKGRLIQVPANYDPDTRLYSGVWNGTFKWAWTNNPAWVFYDLVINERFGLGARIKPDMVDKWTLYQVSQYCDVMVSNGKGGQEPRYTCNIYIQSRKEAWQVLRDIVSIFNGMLHWSGTQITATADMPVAVNTLRTYSRSNVVDGKFIYGSTSEKTIATSALVSFDDPDNHFETAVEAVNDLNLVQRYKTWNQAEISAIGVTSRGQAQRKGKYQMLTNSLNRMVTFKLGLEGYLPRPGEVVGVADQVLAGSNFSGRISAATIKTVTCDRVPNVVAGDILYVNKPDGSTGEGRTVQSVSGKVITVTANYSAIPTVELGWYVEKTTLKSQLYRITKVTWADNDAKFEVTGVQYEDSKYAAIDSGARLESRPITSIPAGGQAAPTALTLTSFTYIEQTMAVTTLSVKWTGAAGAMNYEGQWRKDGGDWNNVGLTASTGFDVKGIYTGAYQARVRAINALGTKSVWVESANTQLTGKVGAPPTLTAFTTLPEIFGIRINWAFQAGADDGAFIQLQQATSIAGANTTELSFVAYPAQTYVKSNMLGGVVAYFRGRLIDRTGNQSAWTPWTYGISEYGTDKILEAITGEIERTELGQNLLSELNVTKDDIEQAKLDLGWIESQVTGLEQQLQNNLDEVNSAVSDINTTIDGLNDELDQIFATAEYDASLTFNKGDITRVGERLYQALVNVPVNTTPPNITYWKDVGQVVSSPRGLAAQVQINTADVSALGTTTTAHTQQLTGLQATLDGIGGSGTNLVPAEYAVFGATKPEIMYGGTVATTAVDAAAMNGYALKLTSNTTTSTASVYTAPTDTYAGYNMACKQGKYILSYYAKSETAGHTIALFLRARNSADAAVSSSNAAQDALTTTWTRYSQVVDLTAASFADKDKMVVGIQLNRSGVTGRVTYIDRIMVEPLMGTNTNPSPFSIGNSFSKVDGLATVTSALSATVTQNGVDITAHGTRLDSVQATLGDLSGSSTNLIEDTYSWLSSTAIPAHSDFNVAVLGVAVAGSASGFGYQITATSAVTNSRTIFGGTSPMQLTAGKYIISYYASANVAAQVQVGVCDTGAANVVQGAINNVTTTRTRYSALVTIPADRTGYMIAYINRAGTTGVVVTMDSLMVERKLGDGVTPSSFVPGSSANSVIANAAATSALSATVSQQGTTLTTLGTAITAVQATLGGAGGTGTNLLPDTYSWLATPTLPQVALSTATSITSVTVAGSVSGYGYRYVKPNVALPWFMLCPSNNAAGWNIPLVPGKYLMSFYASTNDLGVTNGLAIRATLWDGSSKSPTDFTLTATRTRYTAVITIPNSNTYGFTLFTVNGLVGDIVWLDSPMLEKQVGDSIAPSPFTAGSGAASIVGNAAATSALSATVTQQGLDITAAGLKLDTVKSNVDNIGGTGTNLIPAEFTTFFATPPTMYKLGTMPTVSEADATAYSGYLLKASTTVSATGYMYLGSRVDDYNLRISPDKKYIVSFWAKGSANHTVGVRVRYPNSAGTAIETQVALVNVTTTLTRYSAVVTMPTAVVDRGVIVLFTQNTAAIGDTWFDGFMLEAQVGPNATPSSFVPGNSVSQISAQSAVTAALTTRVQATEDSIITTGNAITTINSNIGKIGAAGSNLLNDDYSWITSVTLPPTISGTSLARVGVAVAGSASGFGYKTTTASTSTSQFIMLCPTNNTAGWNVDLEAGTYLVSMYVQGSVAGTMRVSLYDSTHRYSPTLAFTTTRTRLTFVCTATAFARVGVTIYTNMSGLAAGTEVTIDSVMVEKAGSDLTSQLPSPFVPGNSAKALTALATITNAMGTTVSQHGTDITTNGNAILAINATLGGQAQENYVIDPTYNVDKSALSSSSQITIVPQTDVSVPAGASIPRLARWDVPTATGNTYIGWQCVTQQRSPASGSTASMAPGEVYEVSCDVYMDPTGLARQHGIWFQFYDAANASISHNWVTGTISTTNSAWKTLSGTVVVPATVVRGRPTFRASLGDATTIWIANMRWTKQTAAQAGNAAAISTLNANVESLDGKVTSTASEVRSLTATARQNDGTGDLSDALNLWQNNASIQSEAIARANEDGAMAAKVETLIAQVNDNAAMIQQESVARATGDSVQATYTTQVSASLAETNNSLSATNATVQTTSDAVATLNGKVAASYSIKLGVTADGRYYGAGMGIGIENTPAGMQSQVIFLADRFSIMNTASGVQATPFVVNGSQVIMNSAIIGDATIGFAKIADNLQSTNFVSGWAGWALTKGGYLELNGSGGSGRLTISNNVVAVYDANGTLRVRLGLW